MTTKEIYELADEMTNQEVLNVVGGWKNQNEVEALKKYNILVSLGDSAQLACATVIAERYNKKYSSSEFYRFAYES